MHGHLNVKMWTAQRCQVRNVTVDEVHSTVAHSPHHTFLFPHNYTSALVFTLPVWRATRTRPDKPWPCRSTRPVTRATGRKTSLVAAWWVSGRGCWSLHTPSTAVRHVKCLSQYLYLQLLRMLTEIHEGHCEVHSLLPIICDGKICNGNVCFLQQLNSGTIIQQFCTEWSLSHVKSSWNVMAHSDAQEGKWRKNWQMEWVASTLTLPRNMVYPALLPLMRTPWLPVVDWTDAPADLTL